MRYPCPKRMRKQKCQRQGIWYTVLKSVADNGFDTYSRILYIPHHRMIGVKLIAIDGETTDNLHRMNHQFIVRVNNKGKFWDKIIKSFCYKPT